ncbi:hypothetical protein GCM10009639_45590 [Kitasatospora putterlickiae]|uniref:Uncharacterized protein n=1 Tax=Kitasatospora putterlickiae TaxID=221725 RepID=A0ABN1YAB9_9ACTN
MDACGDVGVAAAWVGWVGIGGLGEGLGVLCRPRLVGTDAMRLAGLRRMAARPGWMGFGEGLGCLARMR